LPLQDKTAKRVTQLDVARFKNEIQRKLDTQELVGPNTVKDKQKQIGSNKYSRIVFVSSPALHTFSEVWNSISLS